MFIKPEPLDRKKHASLRFSPATDFSFARTQSSAPIPAGEIIEVARHYAIVFPDKVNGDAAPEGAEAHERVVPQALLSMRAGSNVFVQEDGTWAAPYIPAHIRRYPFILGQLPESGKFAIMVDVEAPHFKSGKGDPLFTLKEDGSGVEPGETITQAREFLGRFQQELEATVKLLMPLEEQGVLVPRKVDVTFNGKETSLAGFRVVDPEKLAALDDSVLAAWVRSGLMSIIYAHLHSLGNVRELARLQPPEDQKAASQTSA